jgi:glycosyltransferase involved in cell wall biosynthesis
MKPLVSIVVPSYNHSKYIKETVLSIVNQTYPNIELIVIDDGSKDNSVEILKGLQKEFDFIFISRENRGLIATLNEGLSLAKGKYFCAVASDDVFMLNKIELQVIFMEKNPRYALCFGKMKIIDENSKYVKDFKSKNVQSGFMFYKIFAKKFIITAPTVMLRKSNLVESGGYSNHFYIEDFPLWLKLSLEYPFGYVNEYLVSYRIHGNNMSSNISKMIQETNKILDKYNIDNKTQRIMNYWYYRWFCDLSKTDDEELTVHYMRKALPTSFYKLRFLRSYFRYSSKK